MKIDTHRSTQGMYNGYRFEHECLFQVISDYLPRLPNDEKRNSFFFQSANGRTYIVIKTSKGKYKIYLFLKIFCWTHVHFWGH